MFYQHPAVPPFFQDTDRAKDRFLLWSHRKEPVKPHSESSGIRKYRHIMIKSDLLLWYEILHSQIACPGHKRFDQRALFGVRLAAGKLLVLPRDGLKRNS